MPRGQNEGTDVETAQRTEKQNQGRPRQTKDRADRRAKAKAGQSGRQTDGETDRHRDSAHMFALSLDSSL